MNDRVLEGVNCRVLLLEIVRRAAYDWVLYRNSRRLENRKLAHEAYTWLFVEAPGHPHWQQRKTDGYEAFSFISICETLGLDLEEVRARLRTITARDIQTLGRPPTRRRLPPPRTESDYLESIKVDTNGQRGLAALLDAGDIVSLE